jgi:putative Ca2+/H+ antiporter (TMEM165/GDT1 family)
MSLPLPNGSSPEPPESAQVRSQDPTAPQPAAADPAAAAAQGAATWLGVFLSTATTVFLAELGDKTQLAALLLSAESGRPGVVFLGASLALICSSLVGVVLGRWLSTVMAPEQLERAAGVLMVALGLWLGRQAVLHLAPLPAAAVAALGP